MAVSSFFLETRENTLSLYHVAMPMAYDYRWAIWSSTLATVWLRTQGRRRCFLKVVECKPSPKVKLSPSLNQSRRPGILVLINDADWELEGEDKYELQPGDCILFVSTLHGG